MSLLGRLETLQPPPPPPPPSAATEKRDENMPETAVSNEEDHAEQGGTEEATRTEPPQPIPIRRSNRTRVSPERYGFKKGGM